MNIKLPLSSSVLLALAVSLVAGCNGNKTDPATVAPAAAPQTDDLAKPTGATVPAPAAAPAAPNGDPSYAGPKPSNDKPFLGLNLPPQGHWKPAYDKDANVAKWQDPNFMNGIVIRVVDDKLDTIDDLKTAAPMMMQLGSAITKVTEEKHTDKGWYAVVSMDTDNTLVYVRKFGTTTVCSAALGKDMGGKTVVKAEVLKACESYSPKG